MGVAVMAAVQVHRHLLPENRRARADSPLRYSTGRTWRQWALRYRSGARKFAYFCTPRYATIIDSAYAHHCRPHCGTGSIESSQDRPGDRFEKLVADYNAGSINTEKFFQELGAFSKELTEEESRALSEGLTEEPLAVFDLLTRPAPPLSDAETAQVKRVAEELLAVLNRDKLVLDWRKQQGTRAAVRVAVDETLDQLPEAFSRQLYTQKCDAVYQHVFDSYWDDGHSVYERAA